LSFTDSAAQCFQQLTVCTYRTPTNNSLYHSMSKKPLVVLAGWLGCQPRSLRRYEELYRRHGLQVLSYIAPPTAIFECTLPSYKIDHMRQNRPTQAVNDNTEMNQLVDRIILDIQASNCSSYIFHCFSNGGCFVWEAFKYSTTIPPAGLIMDSCPGLDLHRITEALNYCTWRERLQVVCTHWRYYYKALNVHTWQQQVQHRSNEYLENLSRDPWSKHIPELYLYSRDDILAPFRAVDALIKNRQEQGVEVYHKVWDNSRHCAHLLDHTHEYEQSIESFLHRCQLSETTEQALRARL
jgi:hypothetical protein